MTKEALKLALEALELDSFYGTKKQDAITAIKEALAQTEQEPLWSDAGDLKRLKKGDVLRVLRKGQEYYSAFRFDGLLQECDYTYDGNAPFVWLEVGMATLDKIVYTRKDTTTGAIYADRGDRVEIFQHINKEALTEPPAQPKHWEKFCDSNCVWTDHHPDCKLANPEQKPKRCSLCNYQHGHAIGCANNPVDIAIQALAQPEQRNVTEQEHDVLMNSIKASSTVVSKGFLAQPEQECKSPEPKSRRPDVHCPDKTCGFLGECRLGYKPENEPVACVEYIPCCTDQTCPKCKAATPPQRKPLSDEEIYKASTEAGMQEHYMGFHSGFIRFARAIEAAHGIKETEK